MMMMSKIDYFVALDVIAICFASLSDCEFGVAKEGFGLASFSLVGNCKRFRWGSFLCDQTRDVWWLSFRDCKDRFPCMCKRRSLQQ